MTGFFVALVTLTCILCTNFDRPWTGHHDFNGAVWSQSAHNALRAGLWVTRGASTGFYFGPLPIPPNGYYMHHPPALPLTVTGAFLLFGEHEWVARAVPIVSSVASAVFLWLLLRSCVGIRAATLGVAVFALLPMELYFGRMVNHEACALLWMLAAFWALRRWQETGRMSWKLTALAFFLLGMETALPVYLLVMVAAALLWMSGDRSECQLAWLLVALAVLAGLLFLAHARLVRADAWADGWVAITRRRSMTGRLQFTWQQWFQSERNILAEYFSLPAWMLATGGAVVMTRNRVRKEQWRWLVVAAASIFFMDTLYVVAFPNASIVHDYAAFYFVAPLAMMGGVALDALLGSNLVRTNRCARAAATGFAILVLVLMGRHAFTKVRDLHRIQYCLVCDRFIEPPNLIPSLGQAMRGFFPEQTLVLCNILPDRPRALLPPQLQYYSERELLNPGTTYAQWQQPIAQHEPFVGGVIWEGETGAADLLAALPEGKRCRVQFGTFQFCLWKLKDNG